MGRPRDQLCWDNVDKLPNGKWRCKHCKNEFSGAASRIRNHLSGQGTDIGSCEKVPPQIQEEALKRGSKKRKRVDSSASGELGNDGISTVSKIGDLRINKGREQEFSTTDLLVKFFVSRNIPLDAVKDPYFRTLLTRVDGFPSCLLRDDFNVIQKSVWNLEYEMNESMLLVKDSWKTTGCTLICYNLRNSENGIVVYGFYCPKGFIFVQGPELEQELDSEEDASDLLEKHLEYASKKHVLNLSRKDVTHFIYHYGYLGCEFGQKLHHSAFQKDISMQCSHQQFQQLLKRICTESGWVQNLIQKSEKLYDFMLNSKSSYLCKGWRKVTVEKDADATPRRAFPHLRSIMHLEDGIKAWASGYGIQQEIIDDKEFWSDGKELVQVVTPLFQIMDLLDTLVPTSGYIQFALDKAKRNLKPYYQRDASKFQTSWDWLDDFTTKQEVTATCFSPFFDWRSIQADLDDPIDRIKEYLLYQYNIGENRKVDAELKVYRYKNPFENLSSYERINHPVTLWKKHGGKFPVLQKYAIQFMSQPRSCMCNQVKKHIMHCQGADNFILRLNYQMMQEFIELGDTIYEPLGNQFFEGLIDAPPRYSTHPISPPTSAAYLGQIPAWMNEFILKSIDVVADGNCGYRAIAESVGLGQDKWREVRLQLYNELISQPQLYEPTFRNSGVETISKALLHNESGFAPPETWLDVTDMGLLVASTFKAKFVVMGSPTDICCTYLPLYLPEGWQFDNVPEIVVCLGYNLHFSSLSLTYHAPLPPICFEWERNRQPSTQDFDRFLSDRCASYDKFAEFADEFP